MITPVVGDFRTHSCLLSSETDQRAEKEPGLGRQKGVPCGPPRLENDPETRGPGGAHCLLHDHVASVPECVSLAAREGRVGALPLPAEQRPADAPNAHREDRPEVCGRARAGQEGQGRRLCHPRAAPLHDARQLMARCHQVHVDWRLKDPRQPADRHDPGSRCAEQERGEPQEVPADRGVCKEARRRLLPRWPGYWPPDHG